MPWISKKKLKEEREWVANTWKTTCEEVSRRHATAQAEAERYGRALSELADVLGLDYSVALYRALLLEAPSWKLRADAIMADLDTLRAEVKAAGARARLTPKPKEATDD